MDHETMCILRDIYQMIAEKKGIAGGPAIIMTTELFAMVCSRHPDLVSSKITKKGCIQKTFAGWSLELVEDRRLRYWISPIQEEFENDNRD